MPFRVVDQEDFQAFIRNLNPKYKLPNSHKVAAVVLELYFEERAKIKSVIEGLGVSITTDTWTSIQKINYMVLKEVDGVTTKAKQVGHLEVDDWEKSVSFAHFLKKFYDATLTLSATFTPTSHLILSTVIALQMEIQEQILKASNATLQSVATSMKLKFDKHWGDIEKVNHILFVAQALDPRYKFEMLETNLEELSYGWSKIREEKVRVKDYVTEMTTKIQRKRAEAQQNEIANEVDMYFNDLPQSLTYEGFNLLNWWKGNCDQYPTLSKVAKDVLVIPSSTVASENVFSLGGRVVDPFRAFLTHKTVEALVCTSDWLGGNEFCFHKEPTLDEFYFYKELERL
ncbi:unnamed protein product [Malus baccata var. baccata]